MDGADQHNPLIVQVCGPAASVLGKVRLGEAGYRSSVGGRPPIVTGSRALRSQIENMDRA